MTDMVTCRRCEQPRGLDEMRQGARGPQSVCKACLTANKRLWLATHPDTKKAVQARYRERHREVLRAREAKRREDQRCLRALSPAPESTAERLARLVARQADALDLI